MQNVLAAIMVNPPVSAFGLGSSRIKGLGNVIVGVGSRAVTALRRLLVGLVGKNIVLVKFSN